jgi:hypothetical protein
MRAKHLLPLLAVAVGASTLSVSTVPSAAAEYRQSKAEKRYATKSWKYRYTRRDDAEYAARAHDLDPAGDYKGYPNWARAALSPKFDGGGNRR